MSQDIAGRKVLNRYKIVEKIGGGGMSVVWKAYDLVLDRHVALKILRPEMSEDEDFIRRFRREAQSVASLSHPNIVNIYDVGEDQGLYFIVMELIGEGETLRDYMKSKGRLPVARALEIAAEICEALSHAHGKRIIHRDIKPQNILLTAEGRAKVADFGIARALGSLSTTTRDMVVGSAPYISPEQAKNGLATAKSDLYSLGVVLYEMLSGRQPFAGDSPVAVALQHVEADAPSLRENAPSIPPAVDELVRKAMAKDPLARFQTAEEMLSAIRSVEARLAEGPLREPAAKDAPSGDQGDAVVAKTRAKRKPLSLAVKLFLGLMALTLMAVAWAGAEFLEWFQNPEVEVPDVVGRSQLEGQGLLSNVGLVLKVAGERFDDKAPAGTILSQSPLGGERAKTGRDVWCTISKGPDYAKVPDVRGKVFPLEVDVEFENAGVTRGDVEFLYHPNIPKDRVISQSVPGGLDVAKGTVIDLKVSQGPEPTSAKVPALLGMNIGLVDAALSEVLLDLGNTVYQYSPGVAEGIVIAQDPPAGTEVPFLSKVNVVVSGEAPAAKHPYTKTFLPKDVLPGNRAARVIISVTDDVQTDVVVYDRTLRPSDGPQTVTFQWQGSSATIKISAGGKVSTETIRP
ncbi:MAG: Stk1 family PASTA domain-containing Ser/Thr kinase [Bacillota bacterium]